LWFAHRQKAEYKAVLNIPDRFLNKSLNESINMTEKSSNSAKNSSEHIDLYNNQVYDDGDFFDNNATLTKSKNSINMTEKSSNSAKNSSEHIDLYNNQVYYDGDSFDNNEREIQKSKNMLETSFYDGDFFDNNTSPKSQINQKSKQRNHFDDFDDDATVIIKSCIDIPSNLTTKEVSFILKQVNDEVGTFDSHALPTLTTLNKIDTKSLANKKKQLFNKFKGKYVNEQDEKAKVRRHISTDDELKDLIQRTDQIKLHLIEVYPLLNRYFYL